MNVVIVDDEPLARQTIESIIAENLPHIKVVGKAAEVNEAVALIVKTEPDLVFLDVDILGGSGFDMLRLLKPIQFKVIFITAHQKYALQAIKFSAFDYILKPVNQHELVAAVNNALHDTRKDNKLNWDVFFGNLNDNEKNKKLVLKTSDSIHLVNISEILRCEADNNYSTFFLVDGVKIVISKGLKEYEELLSAYGFFRVHQSHLVNLNFITRFDKKEGGNLVLSDKTLVPVSQRKKQKLLELFDKIK